MSNTFNIIRELVDVLYKEHINFYNISEKEECEKIKNLEIQVYEQKKMIDNLEKINESNIMLLNKYKSELELLLCVQNKDKGEGEEEKQSGEKEGDCKNKYDKKQQSDKRKESTSNKVPVSPMADVATFTTEENAVEETADDDGAEVAGDAVQETEGVKKEKKRDRRNYMREYQKLYREKKRSEKHNINM
jgi:hypothetical protein